MCLLRIVVAVCLTVGMGSLAAADDPKSGQPVSVLKGQSNFRDLGG